MITVHVHFQTDEGDVVENTFFQKWQPVFTLTFRMTAGGIVRIIAMTATKHIPLTVIGCTDSLIPLVTVILAYLFFKETVKKF